MMQTRTVVFCCALLLAGLRMHAEEHRGVARFGGLALPGATVIAVQGDRKLATVTDSDGVYVFRDLPSGPWTVRVEMLCFESLERQITVAAEAPPAEWDLTLLPVEKMQVVTAPAATPAPATPPTAAATKPEPARIQRPKRGQQPPPPPANTASGFQRAA
ncbi:MAG: carboxypeptidase-like regulatory domain-containing protein, partial [Roseomonas sp.]|nr:carboxypeptidase-like regulatory domain-containing protein [Roseomonas sp.]